MADENDRAKSDKAISLWGGAISSEVYGDSLQPAIQPVAELVGGILSLPVNILGIPLDWANLNLKRFRGIVRDRIEATPPADRMVPPLKISCTVVQQAAFVADEPDLQKMFADLLASACDARMQSRVHPSFPAILGQITPREAQFLKFLADQKGRVWNTTFMEDRSGFSVMEARKLGESLESHGLIGWHYEQLRKVPFLKSEIRGQLNRGAIFPTNPRLKDELKKLSDNVQDAIEKAIDKAVDYVNNASTQNGIELSDKGKDFVAVCMPDIDVEFVNQHVNETTNTQGEIASTGPKGDV